MKKNIIIGVMVVVIVGVLSFIVYQNNDRREVLDNNKQDNDILFEDSKEDLSADELDELESFINKIENNAFILIDYSNPKDILTIDNVDVLRYSINSSNFSRNANDNERRIIWNGYDAGVSTRVSSTDDLRLYMEEKTNYQVSFEEIKNALSQYYNKELDLYYYLISDTLFESHKIVSGYKISNKIYITLDDYSNVVLTYDNDKYYFYSCDKK